MKIAPDRLAALIKDHHAHAILISSMAAGSADAQPASEADIVAAIDRENTKSVKADVERLKGELATAKTAHATAMAGKDAEIADLKAQLDVAKPKGVKALEGGSATPPAAPKDTVARKFPAINKAFIDAVNAKKKEA
jgi:hypothetical protein